MLSFLLILGAKGKVGHLYKIHGPISSNYFYIVLEDDKFTFAN